MSLAEFKPLYWWEWSHRLLGRLVGVVFAVPFVALLATRQMPPRLVRHGVVLFGLGALQGAVGWWMVSSGLETRVLVAPERLAIHLGLALLVLGLALWTGLEALHGPAGERAPLLKSLSRGSAAMVGLAGLQCLLGALVAGNQAGRIYTDWPLMAGQVFPSDYARAGESLWSTLAHSQAAVQFNHRFVAYLLLGGAAALFVATARSTASAPTKRLVLLAFLTVLLQALLGVLTLRLGAPVGIALLHQAGAVVTLSLLVGLLWRSRRE